MRFIDLNGDKEEHYEEVSEYARQRQESEQHFREERQVREWLAIESDNTSFLKIETGSLMKYVVRVVRNLKVIYGSFETRINEHVKAEQLWDDFLLYNLNSFAEQFVTLQNRKVFVLNFAESVLHLKSEIAEDFINNYYDGNNKYIKYMEENFSLERNGSKQFWRLLYQTGETGWVEQYIKIYLRFIYFYTFYLYLKVYTKEFSPCKRKIKQCRTELSELTKKQRNGSIPQSDLKKMQNPLYCGEQQKDLQDILRYMRVILFSLKKQLNDEEGEFEMIEELYKQILEKVIVFDDLNSVVSREIAQDVQAGKLPEFQDYTADILQETEKVHYLDHTILYQGKELDEDIHFYNYKGLLLFTDRRIIFKGEYALDLEYKDISRVTEYGMIPGILEVRSGKKIKYFQLSDTEIAYKILKLIANCKKGEKISNRQISLSYEELVEKADISAYIFAFEYMAAGDLPQNLKKMLLELNCKLRGLKKTIEKNPQREEEIYQFLHYYIPEAMSLVQSYQSYQGTELEEKIVEKVYKKVTMAVQTLEQAVCQKILEIYQTSARDTIAGADALKEILGQDGYVDSSYTINKGDAEL